MTSQETFGSSHYLNADAPEFIPGAPYSSATHLDIIPQDEMYKDVTPTEKRESHFSQVDAQNPRCPVNPISTVSMTHVEENPPLSLLSPKHTDSPLGDERSLLEGSLRTSRWQRSAAGSNVSVEGSIKTQVEDVQLSVLNDGEDWDAESDSEKPSLQEIRQAETESEEQEIPEQPLVNNLDASSVHLGKTDEISKFSGDTLKVSDPRPHLNVVFIGHVDAGKSTTCGNILVLTGELDTRMLEKYEREAKEKNRDSWFYAFIVDINEEERQKGKTVEVGRATFQLEKTRFTILDAPGHKSFVPNMISGAAQADVAVLIISARKGEFETGFEKGGQTREHALLAKTLGVTQLIVAVNKMDDPTCNWSEERYREIEKKLIPYLRSCGYNPAKDITIVPISGLTGANIKLHVSDSSFSCGEAASWYPKSAPTLFQILDNIPPPERNPDAPLRIPLLEGFRDQGVSVVGKVESGTVFASQNAILLPKKLRIKIAAVHVGDQDVAYAKPGENVLLRVVGVEEEQLTKGLVLCSVNNLCPCVTRFKAHILVIELLKHRPILTAGYNCVLHAHTLMEECQVVKLLEHIDKQTKKKKINPLFVKGNSIVICEIQLPLCVCLETFATLPQLGRFTLRDEGKTIAIGKVLEVFE